MLFVAFGTGAYFSWCQWLDETSIPGLDRAEYRAIRNAIAAGGPCTASPSRHQPHPRVLVIPKDVEASFARKPDQTVECLLNIVKVGGIWDSIHAMACIHALLCGPTAGWFATLHADDKSWDDRLPDGNETSREIEYERCAKLIAEKREMQKQEN